jgi:hypothetical protein
MNQKRAMHDHVTHQHYSRTFTPTTLGANSAINLLKLGSSRLIGHLKYQLGETR